MKLKTQKPTHEDLTRYGVTRLNPDEVTVTPLDKIPPERQSRTYIQSERCSTPVGRRRESVDKGRG